MNIRKFFIKEVEVDVVDKYISDLFKKGYDINIYYSKFNKRFELSISFKNKNKEEVIRESGKTLKKTIEKINSSII